MKSSKDIRKMLDNVGLSSQAVKDLVARSQKAMTLKSTIQSIRAHSAKPV